MWTALLEADIITAINGPSIGAARTAALKSGQSDPLPEAIDQVTREVRGRVAACARNVLGEEGTIPDECKTAAIDMCVYRLCKRLGAALLTSAVTDANNIALAFLRDVARCEVAIVAPIDAAPKAEQAGPTPSPIICRPIRRFTRNTQDGI